MIDADLDARDLQGRTAVTHALQNNCLPALCCLFEQNARVDQQDWELLLANENGSGLLESLLLHAVRKGDVGVVRQIGHRLQVEDVGGLARGAAVNDTVSIAGNALREAASFSPHGSATEIATALLEWRYINVNLGDREGVTTLMHACRRNLIGLVEILLARHDVEVNRCDANGKSALLYACYGNRIEVVRRILGCTDVEVLVRANHGSRTPLIHAAKNGNLDILQALLEFNSTSEHLLATDSRGWTALDWAEYVGHVDVINALVAMYERTGTIRATP